MDDLDDPSALKMTNSMMMISFNLMFHIEAINFLKNCHVINDAWAWKGVEKSLQNAQHDFFEVPNR